MNSVYSFITWHWEEKNEPQNIQLRSFCQLINDYLINGPTTEG